MKAPIRHRHTIRANQIQSLMNQIRQMFQRIQKQMFHLI